MMLKSVALYTANAEQELANLPLAPVGTEPLLGYTAFYVINHLNHSSHG